MREQSRKRSGVLWKREARRGDDQREKRVTVIYKLFEPKERGKGGGKCHVTLPDAEELESYPGQH